MGRWKILLIITFTVSFIFASGKKPLEKPSWAKKNMNDFNDGDMERLLEQWEEDEEPLPEDELPPYYRTTGPRYDVFDENLNPEQLMRARYKGRTVLAYVTVSGSPTKEEIAKITRLWQVSLWNNHIQSYLHHLYDGTTIFMFEEGSLAWDAKDYLIQQERCKEVTIEKETYIGKHFKNLNKPTKRQTNKIKSTKGQKNKITSTKGQTNKIKSTEGQTNTVKSTKGQTNTVKSSQNRPTIRRRVKEL